MYVAPMEGIPSVDQMLKGTLAKGDRRRTGSRCRRSARVARPGSNTTHLASVLRRFLMDKFKVRRYPADHGEREPTFEADEKAAGSSSPVLCSRGFPVRPRRRTAEPSCACGSSGIRRRCRCRAFSCRARRRRAGHAASAREGCRRKVRESLSVDFRRHLGGCRRRHLVQGHEGTLARVGHERQHRRRPQKTPSILRHWGSAS